MQKAVTGTFMAEFKDELARKMFGITVTEAHRRGICVWCRKKQKDRKLESWRHYGLCRSCSSKSVPART